MDARGCDFCAVSVRTRIEFAATSRGRSYSIRSAPIWHFDIEDPIYTVPLGLGVGKVIPTQKIMFNIFAEPQFAIALRGTGQPAIQLFFGMNMTSMM